MERGLPQEALAAEDPSRASSYSLDARARTWVPLPWCSKNLNSSPHICSLCKRKGRFDPDACSASEVRQTMQRQHCWRTPPNLPVVSWMHSPAWGCRGGICPGPKARFTPGQTMHARGAAESYSMHACYHVCMTWVDAPLGRPADLLPNKGNATPGMGARRGLSVQLSPASSQSSFGRVQPDGQLSTVVQVGCGSKGLGGPSPARTGPCQRHFPACDSRCSPGQRDPAGSLCRHPPGPEHSGLCQNP